MKKNVEQRQKGRTHFKIALLILLCFLVAAPFTSAELTTLDNWKSYDSDTREATIKDLTGEIGKARLNSPLNVKVGLGYQKVAEFDLWAYEDYNDIIKSIEFYDKNFEDWENKKLSKDFDIKYKNTETIKVDDYTKSCYKAANETEVCESVKDGFHYETIEAWEKVTPAVLMKDEKVTVGIFTNVKEGDYVEWIPTIYGVKIDEWATWTADLNTNLDNYYKLDESSGTIIDSIENNNGTYNGALYSQTGKLGTSIGFDGTDDKIAISAAVLDGSTNFTINAWAATDDNGYRGEVFSVGSSSSTDPFILLRMDNDAKAVGYIQSDNQNNIALRGTTSFTNGVFYMLTLTWDATTETATLYVNNNSEDSDTDTALNTFTLDKSSIGCLGRTTDALFFDGEIDEVGIWNRKLTHTEIGQLYNNGIGITYVAPSGDNNPVITFDSPAAQNYTTAPQNLNFNFTASDDISLSSVKLYVNSVLNQTNASGINNSVYTFPLTLGDGEYNIYAKATDNASQETDTATRTYIIDSTPPTINISSPTATNVTFTLPINLTLDVTTSDAHIDTCWYYTSDNATNITYTCNTTQIIQFDTGGYKTIYAYANDTLGNENSNSTTFLLNYVQENAIYDTSIIEQENYTVQLNITASYIGSINGTLHYNGVDYNTTVTQNGSTAILTTNLTAPSLSANLVASFNWTYNLNGQEYNTSTYQHTIFELTPLFFSASCDDKALKFNLIDEANGSALTGDIEFNFRYGTVNATSEHVYGSLSGVSTFYGCINASVSPNYTIGYGEIQYRTASHVDRRYYLFEGSIISNTTTNVTLYDLLEVDQTSFKLEVEASNLDPYTDKYTALIRWYPELNEYNVVDMGLTDETGSTVIHVRTEDVDYRIGVYEKNGSLIKLAEPIRMVCLLSPCTYTLKILPGEVDYTSFLNVDYNLDYNETTGIWTFTFSDSTQETSNVNLTVYKMTGTSVYPVCSDAISAYTGALTCNTSAYTGTLKAVVMRSASPAVPLAEKIVGVTTSAFKSSYGLWISLLIAIPIIFVFAYMSPVAAVLGGVVSLIPSLYFGAINWVIMGGIAVLAGIVMHFLKRIG